ncbi:type VI secretion system-associated protein TagF [Massilia sp. DJPM01]|uniref:type VI secretion system-associated protein TagF n=1 Tax=Massilia sp. DJPM01 TaxID=3024404 RepID=UPI00259EB71E|nr:type VI secretion system-associated protein TagF [Massilia sp. DJPM01]MDM5175692.1 type VI secretion system-associated protein TagF [Massilia sp. DJPM01]
MNGPFNTLVHGAASAPVGWFGKIPSAGDFVRQQLPYALLGDWEHWLQNGLAALQQAGPGMLATHYAVAPLWNFLLPAGLGHDSVQLGVLAPSCDRVGRYYPVAALWPVPIGAFHNGMLERCDEFYGALGQALLEAIRHGHAIDRLGAALAQVNTAPMSTRAAVERDAFWRQAQAGTRQHAKSSPDLALYFDAASATSFWWTNQGDGSPLKTCTHTGQLNNALFARLFGPQQGSV